MRNVSAGARGEAILRLGDEERPILFTVRALADAETQLGKTIQKIGQSMQADGLPLADLARLTLTGLEAARRDAHPGTRPYTIADAWAIIESMGFLPATKAVFEAISMAYNYDGSKADDNPPALRGTGGSS